MSLPAISIENVKELRSERARIEERKERKGGKKRTEIFPIRRLKIDADADADANLGAQSLTQSMDSHERKNKRGKIRKDLPIEKKSLLKETKKDEKARKVSERLRLACEHL